MLAQRFIDYIGGRLAGLGSALAAVRSRVTWVRAEQSFCPIFLNLLVLAALKRHRLLYSFVAIYKPVHSIFGLDQPGQTSP